MKEELRIALAKAAYGHLQSFLSVATERKDWEILTPGEQADYLNFVEQMIRHLGSNEVQEAGVEWAVLLPHSFWDQFSHESKLLLFKSVSWAIVTELVKRAVKRQLKWPFTNLSEPACCYNLNCVIQSRESYL